MPSVADTVQRFRELPYRGNSYLMRDDQVYSRLHLLYPSEYDPNHDVNQEVTANLIFVAGLGGHYRDTWRGVDGTIWPQDLLHSEEHGVQGIRVWSFEYNTTLRGSSHVSKIYDHARELLALMMIKIVGRSWVGGPRPDGNGDAVTVQLKPIVFVGHSLGGMLIKKAMLIAETEDDYKILWQATRGAMFFAVPHHGLDRQDWKHFVTMVLKANPPVLGMRPTTAMEKQAATNSEALLGVTQDFRRLQEFLFFVNYTEGSLLPGMAGPLIAEGRGWMDAPRKVELQLEGHHLGICRFEKTDPRERKAGSLEIVVSHLKHLMGASKALEHIGDEAKAALESLCPTGFHGYFMAKQATVGTCGWIAQRKAFKDWAGNDKESRMLWIQGPPASGKSYLSRHIITSLIPPSTSQKVAHCFLDDSVPGRRRLEHLLRATLHHALRVEPELIQHYLVPPYLEAVRASESSIPDDDIWTVEVLVPIWPQVVAEVTSRGVLTVVVDGFGEMSLECQQGFLKCLDDFKFNKAESEEQRDRLKVLLVSRDDAEAEEQLEGRDEFEVYKIKPEDVQEDIAKTVMATMALNSESLEGQDPELAHQQLQALDQGQVDEIRNTIVASSGGNFVVAKMKAQIVTESLAVDTPEATIALVKELPDDIAGIYDETLKRVEEEGAYLPFVKQLLRWAAFQMEPLREAELNTAVALGMAREDEASTSDGQAVSREKLEALEKLIGSTRSLVEKHARNLVEIREGLLQPADEVLRDRLTQAASSGGGGLGGMEEGPSHAALASTCINYLTMEYFEDSHKPMADSLEEKVKKRIEDHAFSRYAALHWMEHVEAAGSAWQGVDDHIVRARQLLEDDATHYSISCSELEWFLKNKTMKGYHSGSEAAGPTRATTPAVPKIHLPSATTLPGGLTETSHDEPSNSSVMGNVETSLGHDEALFDTVEPGLKDESPDSGKHFDLGPAAIPQHRDRVEGGSDEQKLEPNGPRSFYQLQQNPNLPLHPIPNKVTAPPISAAQVTAGEPVRHGVKRTSTSSSARGTSQPVVLADPKGKVTVYPIDHPTNRQEEQTTNAPSSRAHEGRRSNDNAAPVTAPQPKLHYPVPQAYPGTTSTSRHEGRSTAPYAAIPRSSSDHATRERRSSHSQHHRAVGADHAPAIRTQSGRSQYHTPVEADTSSARGDQYEEPEEDSELEGESESVLGGDETKKKKRSLLRRAMHKTKKMIVKGVAKK